MARALALSLIILTACGGGEEAAKPLDAPPASPVTGVITRLHRAGDAISALTLDVEGISYRIRIDPERDYGFDLDHLDEHVSEKQPVRVSFEERADGVYATAIDDA